MEPMEKGEAGAARPGGPAPGDGAQAQPAAPLQAQIAAVALGGALGALLRAAQGELLPSQERGDLLGAVFIMNVVGSLSLGAFLGLIGDHGRGLLRALVGVGIYGAYTTFGAFELVVLGADGVGPALAYALGSVALGVASAAAGLRLGRRGPRALALVLTLGPALVLVATLPVARRAPLPDAAAALAVALGGAAGALSRAGVAYAGARVSTAFPWGTLATNVTGSFLAGLLAPPGSAAAAWHPLVLTGWLGGFTTFSTFSVEAVRLEEGQRRSAALLYVLGNVVLGLAAAALGVALAARG